MPRLSPAFTLLELIIVLMVIGLIAAIGLPGINRVRNQAETENMRSRAVQLQTAKYALSEAVGRDNASTQWASYNDADRYINLLRQYLPTTFPATLDLLIPSPYAVALGASLDTNVSLTAPDGSNIPLQKY